LHDHHRPHAHADSVPGRTRAARCLRHEVSSAHKKRMRKEEARPVFRARLFRFGIMTKFGV
jgi:hypothetical protein